MEPKQLGYRNPDDNLVSEALIYRVVLQIWFRCYDDDEVYQRHDEIFVVAGSVEDAIANARQNTPDSQDARVISLEILNLMQNGLIAIVNVADDIFIGRV